MVVCGLPAEEEERREWSKYMSGGRMGRIDWRTLRSTDRTLW